MSRPTALVIGAGALVLGFLVERPAPSDWHSRWYIHRGLGQLPRRWQYLSGRGAGLLWKRKAGWRIARRAQFSVRNGVQPSGHVACS